MAERLAVSVACTPVRTVRYEGDGRSPAEVITETVAALEGVDPMDLPPLYESVEPDALNALFAHRGADAEPRQVLCFAFHGWNVFVRSDGTITVGDPEQTAEPTPLFDEAVGD